MKNTTTSNRCTKCQTRIPKTRSTLVCTHCDEVKHLRCMKLSKKEAQLIIESRYPWTCYDCLADALPVNACLPASSKEDRPIGPKYKVRCNYCKGMSYSPANVRTCQWCENIVHAKAKCFSNELGCKNCCEDLIPGYLVNSYQLLDDILQNLTKNR